MDHVAIVGGLQGTRHLGAQLHRIEGGERPARQSLRQVLAFDEFHHQESHTLVLVESVQDGDVRVVQRGQDLGLALEPFEALRMLLEPIRQDLYRDLTLEGRIEGTPDDTHPTFAEFLFKPVVTEHTAGFHSHPPFGS